MDDTTGIPHPTPTVYLAQVWTGDVWRTLGAYRTEGYARRRLAIWDRHEGQTSEWRCQETRVLPRFP